ncbi:MAG: hypothetical protein P4N59_18530 [Negativicutes bacterium]|nr:hypothetical protein [Negativicutes bacterium]
MLIDMVTDEYEENGERWGKVLGGRPIVADDIAERLGIHAETARNNLRRLKKYEYIRTRRTPRGESINVRKSIKWLMRSMHEAVTTGPSNQSNIAELVQQLRTIPGVVAQDRDFGVMGKLCKEYGHPKVSDALIKLREAAIVDTIKEPVSYLNGILRKNKGSESPGATSGYLTSSDAWTEVLGQINRVGGLRPWSNALIGEAVKQVGGLSTIKQSPPGSMMWAFIGAYKGLLQSKKAGG